MAWPLPSHFRAVLQVPRVAFRDPRLQVCSVEKDTIGQPRPWAGSFAVVYKGIGAGDRRPFAIRCFSTESPERRERYGHVHAYVKNHPLRCLVNFEYRDAAIRSAGDGNWYPLVVMDWVEGATLFEYVRARCLAGRAASVAKAVHHWHALVRELDDAGMAHGDLHHANVLVTRQGRLKLVDYDGMCVPALAGRRNLETGVKPYQHPRRNGATLLSPRLDDFSALVIYVGLRALAARPDLWSRHVEQCGYDKLLFRADDFLDPRSSSLRKDLENSPDREVRRLANILWASAAADIGEVPRLADLLRSRVAGGAKLPGKERAGAKAAPNVPTTELSGTTGRVVLEVVSGPIEGQRFVYDRHDTFLFGRGADCHAQILDDSHVSRHHFILEFLPPHARIRDLGSRNGTWVNGVKYGGRISGEDAAQAARQQYPEVDLQDGDRVRVGRTTIQVRVEMPASCPGEVERPVPIVMPDGTDDATRPLVPGYQLGEEIGRGRLSVVYRAVDKADGRLVAAKIVVPRMPVSPEEGDHLLRMIDRGRQVQHPHVVPLLASGWAGCGFYFVMEHCSGGSVEAWLRRHGGKLTLTEAYPLMIQCLDALQYVHARNFVHGALKPQNILLDHVDGRWVAKIADLIVARAFEVAGLSGMTATGQFHVDYHFTPREQVVGFRECRPSGDLWSLGAVFYHLLTGDYAYEFKGHDPLGVILNEAPVPLRSCNPSVPPALARVIDRALAPDPARRPRNATDMRVALEEAFAELGRNLR